MTLHPSHHARTMPDKPAYQMAGSGSAITYGELDRVSNQGAQQLPRAWPQNRRTRARASHKKSLSVNQITCAF